MKEGDSVNVSAERKTWESCLLGREGVEDHQGVLHFHPMKYIVKKSKTKVNMSLHIGGEKNPLEKYYTLVRVKGKRY